METSYIVWDCLTSQVFIIRRFPTFNKITIILICNDRGLSLRYPLVKYNETFFSDTKIFLENGNIFLLCNSFPRDSSFPQSFPFSVLDYKVDLTVIYFIDIFHLPSGNGKFNFDCILTVFVTSKEVYELFPLSLF